MSRHRHLFLPLLIALVLCSSNWTVSRANAEGLTEARAEIDKKFLGRLNEIADKCDELKLTEQAIITRKWYIHRDPRRQYIFAPAAVDPMKPSKLASKNVHFWHKSITKARKTQAEKLFELSRRRLADSHPAEAYQLLYEVLREDPDHLPARRILGYLKVNGRWQRLGATPKARSIRRAHPQFGWRKYWRVESEHFRITTNVVDRKVALAATEELERLYDVWRQLFVGYWDDAATLKRLFDGLPVGPAAKKQHRIVLVRNRKDYIALLKPKNPLIEQGQGIYFDSDKTTYIFAGDTHAKAIWYHEVTHQLFQETHHVPLKVGRRQNCWIIEGVALYMESLAAHEGYYTVGGADANRLQFARYHVLHDEIYRPLKNLVALGRDELQRDREVRQLYSQSAGLAHFLMDHDGGRHRRALVNYLRRVYQGRDNQQTLELATDMNFAELDEQYRESLAVSDADLQYLNPPQYVRNLLLGSTTITDGGLANVAHCKQLEMLDLSYTKTTNAGLAHLSGLSNLNQLSLAGTQITDEGLVHLHKLKRLKTLGLQNTNVTAEGVRRLKRALPSLEEVEH